MIRRLRPLPSPEVLRQMYPEPHDHRRFGRGHAERVDATIALAVNTLYPGRRIKVADLSCGNAVIARAVKAEGVLGELHLGDLAGVSGLALEGEWGYPGPIEYTIGQIPDVDLFVCSETIEHLEAPANVLHRIRLKASHLLLSTPIDCWEDDNPEHLWAWDREGVESMLVDAGWQVDVFASLDTREYGEPYHYGMWVCS